MFVPLKTNNELIMNSFYIRRSALLLSLFIMVGFWNESAAQIVVDGNNCEWNDADAQYDSDPSSVTASANLMKLWSAKTDSNQLIVALEREGSGNSFFAIYFNTDCDTTNNDVSKSGADVAVMFDLNSGVIQDFRVWEYDALNAQYVASTNYFTGAIGRSVCSDTGTQGEFMELSLDLNNIFDICGGGSLSCGSVSIVGSYTHAGGSTSSSVRDRFEFDMGIAVNLPPTANMGLTDTIGCHLESFILDASSSTSGDETSGTGDSIVSYEWDIDYNGNFATDYTGMNPLMSFSNNGLSQVALIVTDQYGCKDTAVSGIDVYTRPEAIAAAMYVAPVAPYCASLSYTGLASIDHYGANNLTHFWSFGDGNTSTNANGDHDYLNCSGNNIYYVATDPDVHAKCASDTAFFTIALPVEMLTFSGELISEGRVQLTWSTASEHNNKGFHIMASVDGHNWEKKGFVNGNGNSNNINSYIWNSSNISHSGVMYFKLMQEDFNGETVFTEVVKVNFASDNQTSLVYPSTSSTDIKIDLSKYSDLDVASVRVTSADGKVVIMKSLNSTQLNQLDISTLPNGMYIVDVQINSKSRLYKIVKN